MLIVVVLLPWLHMQDGNSETKIEDNKRTFSVITDRWPG